jgi:mannan endo-1,4-beta-mannosidase
VTQTTPRPSTQWSDERMRTRLRKGFSLRTCAAVIIGVAILTRAGFIVASTLSPQYGPSFSPTQSVRYLGVYEPDAPALYTGVDQFAQAVGRQPNIVSYYSHWETPFQVTFATAAAKRGAETLVQIAPKNTLLASIASGQYDAYLSKYALAVKAFKAPVILSFGHEMNGNWYSWGFGHTSPAQFVAAWRHIVNLFRNLGTRNVTWMWTVNIIGLPNHSPTPKPWWPGSSYVNWVGIDGYYRSPSSRFASVFGPTIANVREFTHDPILIAETATEPSSEQSAQITDLFSSIRTFGLLGFVWFNEDDRSASSPGVIQHWRLTSPGALAAFRRDARLFMRDQVSSTSKPRPPSSGSPPP